MSLITFINNSVRCLRDKAAVSHLWGDHMWNTQIYTPVTDRDAKWLLHSAVCVCECVGGCVLPGISLTVVLPGYDVLEQLSSCHPVERQRKHSHVSVSLNWRKYNHSLIFNYTQSYTCASCIYIHPYTHCIVITSTNNYLKPCYLYVLMFYMCVYVHVSLHESMQEDMNLVAPVFFAWVLNVCVCVCVWVCVFVNVCSYANKVCTGTDRPKGLSTNAPFGPSTTQAHTHAGEGI